MQRSLACCVLAFISSLLVASPTAVGGGAALMRQMKATGKPALIVAGDESCVYCRQMVAELAGNQEIQPLVRQFFVLKVHTDSPDWPLLQKAFQFNKNGIPAVFVVRGDGKLLYSESGKPRNMAAFLQQQLDSAGTILSNDQLRAVENAVRQTRAAMKRHRLDDAVALVNEYGDTGSYATVALQIAELKDSLIAQAISESDRAGAQITNDKRPVNAAIALVELKRSFAELPAAIEHVEAVWTKLSEDEKHKSLMQHAERLEQAQLHQDEKQYEEALAIYREVAAADPDSQAGAFAKDEIPGIERRLAAKSGDTANASDSSAADASSDGSSERDAKRAASYIRLAKAFRDSKPEKAREYLEKAIGFAPSDSVEAEEAQQLIDALDR